MQKISEKISNFTDL